MEKRKVSIFSVLVLIVGVSGLGLGVYSLYNYQQLINQVEPLINPVEPPKTLLRVFVNASTVIPDDIFTTVDFNAIDFDVTGDFNITTNRFICPSSGYYLVSAMITFFNMSVGEIIIAYAISEGVFKSGSYAQASHTYPLSTGFTDVVYLNVGGYLYVGVYHTGSAPRDMYGNPAGTYTYVTITAVDN